MTGAARSSTVRDVMVRRPKTLALEATVAEAREAFEDDHVHMLLLAERGILRGTLVREDLPSSVRTGRAQAFAVLEGRTVTEDVGADEALRRMLDRGQRRLAVVGPDGALLGLLCLKRRLTGFCSDVDVAARKAEVDRRQASDRDVC